VIDYKKVYSELNKRLDVDGEEKTV
jgi:hypothetical protein